MATAPKKDDLKAKFEAAAAAAKKTKKKPDNATLLKLYSYYKQATEGDVKGDRPGGLRFRRRRQVRRVGQVEGEQQGRRDDQLREAGRQAQSRLSRPFQTKKPAEIRRALCIALPATCAWPAPFWPLVAPQSLGLAPLPSQSRIWRRAPASHPSP